MVDTPAEQRFFLSSDATSGSAHGNDAPPHDEVGHILRKRRKAKQMTLKEVASAAGLSESHLSHLERGRANGSVAVLQKVAQALGLQVSDLFAKTLQSSTHIVRIEKDTGFTVGGVVNKKRLTPPGSQFQEVFSGELPPLGTTGPEPYSHGDSEETLIVLEGEVTVEVDGEEFKLERLEAISYQSFRPHKVSAPPERGAKLLWIISPPSY